MRGLIGYHAGRKEGIVTSPAAGSQNALVFATLLSGIATFAFYPLVVLDLTARGFTVGEAGLVFGFLAGTGQLLSLIVGRAVARYGGKWIALFGLLTRIVGLVTVALGSNLLVCCIGGMLAGIGSAATVLSLKSELIRTSDARQAVAKRSLAVNAGAFVGPGFGGILYSLTSFHIVVAGAIVLYLAIAIIVSRVVFQAPEGQRVNTTASSEPRQGRGKLRLPEAPYLRLLLNVGLYWFLYAQLGLVVPILALAVFSTTSAAGWMYMVNATVVIMCQYWLVVKRLSGLSASWLMTMGFAAMMLASICLLTMPSAAFLVLYVVLFSFGELLISPGLDERTAVLRARSAGVSTAFGTSATVAGLTTMLAASVYGSLIGAETDVSTLAFFSLAVAAVGATVAVYGRTQNKVRE